jgi:hypothetical protein
MTPTILLPLHLLCDATNAVIAFDICRPIALIGTTSKDNLTRDEFFDRPVLAHCEIPFPKRARLQPVVKEKHLLSVPLVIELNLESESVACVFRQPSFLSVKPD